MGQSTSSILSKLNDISEEDALRVLEENNSYDLNECDKDGKNALHWAASTGILLFIYKLIFT